MNELLCLTADKNIAAALEALLGQRQPALGIRKFSYEIIVHPRRDPGCYYEGAAMLRGFLTAPEAKGLLVFDFAWEGNPHANARETEDFVTSQLEKMHLHDRTAVIVLEPEIETWVWTDSPHVAGELGWNNLGQLRSWLESQDLWTPGQSKPHDPKKALEAALKEKRIPRSSSIYRHLATKVSLAKCQDQAFARLRQVLQRWFPPSSGGQQP